MATQETKLRRARAALHRLYGIQVRNAPLAECAALIARSMTLPSPTTSTDRWALVTRFLKETHRARKEAKMKRDLDTISRAVWRTEGPAFIRRRAS